MAKCILFLLLLLLLFNKFDKDVLQLIWHGLEILNLSLTTSFTFIQNIHITILHDIPFDQIVIIHTKITKQEMNTCIIHRYENVVMFIFALLLLLCSIDKIEWIKTHTHNNSSNAFTTRNVEKETQTRHYEII